ncbi:hypothetical protein Tco_1047386, partial [Tanacetum coccineum]
MPVGLGSFDVIIGDKTLTIRSNRSDGYASIVASKPFDRIGALERDNLRLGGMLCVERKRVDRLRRSMPYTQKDFEDIHVDPSKIQSIKDWASPKTPIEICQILGLA